MKRCGLGQTALVAEPPNRNFGRVLNKRRLARAFFDAVRAAVLAARGETDEASKEATWS